MGFPFFVAAELTQGDGQWRLFYTEKIPFPAFFAQPLCVTAKVPANQPAFWSSYIQ